ncbi:methyltransferase [Lewinella sp. LCG006]|uniref:methyltransferase n=1 Tax=Lewinella sp. LCG006 TaxID=3231911 RepID=UPI0034615F31
MIKKVTKRALQSMLWLMYRWYNGREHWHTMDGIEICLEPSVFHPRWFLTTRTFVDFAKTKVAANDTVLELGAGNGLLALSCSKMGSIVTASDINPAAVSSIRRSAHRNGLDLEVITSDLFVDIPHQHFDFIFINPPYFAQAPTNDQERAFLCGENFEYFEALFPQLLAYQDSTVYFILTDACDFASISTIAQQNHRQLVPVHRRKTWGEEHIIYILQA